MNVYRRLVLRDTLQLLRRSHAFAAFVAVGVAFIVAAAWFVEQASRAAEDQVLESSIMRTIEVSSVGLGDPIPITRERIHEVENLPGVRSVEPWMQAGFLVLGSDVAVPGVLWATPGMDFGQPPVVASARDPLLPLEPGEVILPNRAGNEDLSSLVGQEIEVEYTVRTGADTGEPGYVAFRVVGLYDSAVAGRDGPAAAYLDRDTVLELVAAVEGVTVDALGRQVPYPRMIVEVDHSEQVPDLQRILTQQGYAATSIQSQLELLPPAVRLFSFLGNALTIGLVLVCAGAGLSIGAGVVRARRSEIGLLKAIGFSNGRVARLFGLELSLFGLGAGGLGATVGLAFGLAVSQLLRGDTILGVVLAEQVVFPEPWRVAAIALAPAVAMLVGGIVPMARAATLPPDTALRETG